METLRYPLVRKDENVEEVFHGTKVKDAFRWLENSGSLETRAFIKAQNDISLQFLEKCEVWEKFNEKLTKLWNYPKFGCPFKHGQYYYFSSNSGLQNQSTFYRQKTLNSEPTVVLDPNVLSEDGTVALAQKSFSENGAYVAYGLSQNGSDWIKVLIRDVGTGNDFEEVLEGVKFSEIAWTKDNKGFFYSRYPDQNGITVGSVTNHDENQKLFYHYIGNLQECDVLVVEFPEQPSWRIQSVVSDCGKYLIMSIVKDCRDNILYYSNLSENDEICSIFTVHKIIEKFESDYEYITNIGSKVYFRTNKGAPNYRVVIIDFEQPMEVNWMTLIPEHEKNVLDWAKCVDEDKLLLCYIQDVKSTLQCNSLTTGHFLRNFDLDIGTIVSVSGHKKYSEIFFTLSSFLNAGTIYYYDFQKTDTQPSVYREILLNLNDFKQEDYKVEQVFYYSKDSTKIPMFIICKNIINKTPRPCLLYGYGGFNISLQPSFSITGLMFIDTFDGVLAYPNLRGGGEYGEKWHNSGRLLNKQNVFDDFQAAAQYLIDNKYTVKNRLSIQGGSNGGLLVAACINQRPDLFGAAIVQVGVMDMLRFHKFTIGHAWCSDYGNPSEKEHFLNLLKYSPLHNIRCPVSVADEYPSTLILTADHDDRVSPLHSLKFAAALQDTVGNSEYQKNPLLLRVYTKAGHGTGKPTSKRIDEATDILTFIFKSLKLDIMKL